MGKRFLAATIALAASAVLWSGQAAAASCDRACLERVMAGYLAKLQAGTSAGVPIASGAMIRENTHAVALGDGLWRHAGPIKSEQTFADTATGNVWSYAAMRLRDGPLAQISVRLKVANGKISEIETLANTGMRDKAAPYPGGPYDAENLLEQSLLYLAPVPPARRSTREELIRIANGYFEAIGTHNPDVAKFGARCERYESGARGTNQLRRNADQAASQGNWSGTCGSSLTGLTGQQTIERRFPVVDVERGVVVGYMFITHHERTPPQDNFINEMFKIVDGKIQQMDAVGFNLPAPATAGFH